MTMTKLTPFASKQNNGVWFCRVDGSAALVGPFASEVGAAKFAAIGILDPIVNGRQVFCSRDEMNRKWFLTPSGRSVQWGAAPGESIYFFEQALLIAFGAPPPKFNYYTDGAIGNPRPNIEDWRADEWVDPAPWAGDLMANRRAIASLAEQDRAASAA